VRFLAAGGCLFETPFEGAVVHPDGVLVGRAEFQNAVVSRCDGAFFCDDAASAAGQKTDGVCLVVEVVPKDFPKK